MGKQVPPESRASHMTFGHRHRFFFCDVPRKARCWRMSVRSFIRSFIFVLPYLQSPLYPSICLQFSPFPYRSLSPFPPHPLEHVDAGHGQGQVVTNRQALRKKYTQPQQGLKTYVCDANSFWLCTESKEAEGTRQKQLICSRF